MVNIELTKPLPFKEIPIPDWYNKDEETRKYWTNRLRVIFFDPTDVYKNVGNLIDPNKRIQSNLSIALMFPDREDKLCPCGCNNTVKRRWASQDCANFAWKVYHIICYGTAEGRKYIETYYGKTCSNCPDGIGCDIDHIVPVKHGGGGCWLSNFTPLCHPCHVDKTNRDFGWGKHKVKQK